MKLQRCDTKCQIINLGCGFDTLYWRLKDTTQAVGNFIELDFPAVTSKKCHIIKRNKQLLEKICNEGKLFLFYVCQSTSVYSFGQGSISTN